MSRLRRAAGRALLTLATTLVLLAPAAAWAAWPSDAGRGPCAVSKQSNVEARMRDGVVLRADVYRPDSPAPVPVILMRTQYGKEAAQVQPARFETPGWYASHCYIVVVQDIRGQGASDGVFYEYAHDRDDGYDSVEWAARLPGANGRVGMYGSSYVGATQWLAATAAPPSLKAIVPSNTASDYYDGWTYEDGAFRLGFIEPWMTDTIATTAAANRKDAQALAGLKAAARSVAVWLRFTPYSRLPTLQPDNPVVAPYFFDAIRHPADDAYWRAFSIQTRYSQVTVPVLAFEGWYDAFVNGALRNFDGMRREGGSELARRNQRIVIGPWEHLGWGRPESPVSPRLKAIGPVADSPVNALTIAWFDHVLKGQDNGVAGGPQVDYFVMGENRWHVADQWPLPSTDYQTWTLASGGHANSVMGDGVLSPAPPLQARGEAVAHPTTEGGVPVAAAAAAAPSDQFTYDPANPVPSIGGHSCCAWSSGPQGQFDQSAIEQRPDILVFSSAPLAQPLEVTGPVTVILYARSTAPDTDFTAKLVDVFPDGTAVNLSNGIQRASFRDSLSHPTPIVPGQVYRYRINVWPTSNLFAAGHRIRLEISSSDFPQFAPNPNTGEPFGATSTQAVAVQTILHDIDHPSAVILPVIPAGAAGPGADHPPAR
ncbi:CocE/NonD family hydrolase [Caulobacter sp. KR2-114]|uniref:CocE/NonD family hydrolase n=1 Tax=Caulobacter sp. KR2-114 TaxID=3400912 RepID=UPI003C09199B